MTRSVRLPLTLALVLLALPALAGTDAPPLRDDAAAVLIPALADELARSVERLSLPGFERPYFVSYLLKEDRVFSTGARFGALVQDSDSTRRTLYADVRVGTYEFDNSSERGTDLPFDPHADMSNLFRYVREPIDLDATALRNQLWLLTDAKYKQALSAYEAKRGRQVYVVEEKDRAPDLSREQANVFTGEPVGYRADGAKWRDLVRRESAFLRDTPHLTDSEVQVTFDEERKYFVNSEGSRVFADQLFFSLVARAEARAEDGMPLSDSYTFYTRSPEAIADEATIHAGIARAAQNVLALREAEVIDPYTGPALLDPSVAGVFFHEAIGHRLEGERQKNPEEGRTFTGKVGQPILPEFLSIVDDPTLESWRGVHLNGHYRVDDEGVAAQRVVLVENGVLRNFLLSRSPVKGFVRSNGHGRNGSYEAPMSRMGNLFVSSTREASAEKLKAMLLKEVRAQGKPYGLILRKASGGETQTGSFSFQAFRNRPTLIYKIDASTGKETLVRGAEIVGTPLVSISKILATGDDYQVFNGFCGAESGYVPVSSITPSCLVREIELQKIADKPQRPPILPPPTTRREK
jgi:predicted Zn-dependent protease